MTPKPDIVIAPSKGWQCIDVKELIRYRDLGIFLVWRDLKIRYVQSILGIGWAVVQPVASMLIFSIIFGKFASMPSDGVPYPLFSYAALVPWAYFSNALTDSANSLVGNKEMVSKIYFPRIMLPISASIGKLVDFVIALMLTFVLMFWYGLWPSINALWHIPLLTFLLVVSAAGLGMWLSALSIQYRDIRYGMNFGVQLLMYVSPVVYSVSMIPEKYQLLYALNPMVGVIQGFRSTLLGIAPGNPDVILVSCISACVLFVTGAFYFRKTEKIFADVA